VTTWLVTLWRPGGPFLRAVVRVEADDAEAARREALEGAPVGAEVLTALPASAWHGAAEF
jgi:hypothetical protein